MLCPGCKNSLTQEVLHGQTIDRCHNCNGVWFDESELGQVIRQIDTPKITGRETKHGPTGIDCPQCKSSMTLFNYAHDSGIFINKCRSCSGVWLANGQLQLICRYRIGSPAVQSLENALGVELRKQNRWELIRNIIRSRLISGFVAIAYLLVAWFLTGDAETLLTTAGFLLFPLGCIWFCTSWGNLVGIAYGLVRPRITQETPSDFVAIGGWILLLTPGVVTLFYLWHQNS